MNLTKVAQNFKTGVFYLGGFVLFYYILILVLIPTGTAVIRALIPEKNPPTLSYGVLPPLEFTTKAITGTPKYELNTQTGKLPNNLPTKMKVYKFKPLGFSYNAGKSAQDNAAYMGFTDADLITDLKGKTYKWRSLKTGGILEIQIDTKAMVMNTTLLGKSSMYTVGEMTESNALKEVTNLLERTGRIDDLYLAGSSVINKGKYVGNKLVQTEDRNDTQIFRIDFFRNVDGYKVIGPDPKSGLLKVYFGKEVTPENTYGRVEITPGTFPMMNVYYNEIDPVSTATYPVISASQAWEAVKQGKGIVANVTPKGANPFVEYETTTVQNILINDIYFGYYETPQSQKYLQPVYVFEGNYKTQGTQGGDITIYFPAIAGEYVQSVTTPQE